VTLRIQCLDIDVHDPALVARFWAETLGWRVTHESEQEWAVEPPEGSREDSVVPDLLFLKVPDDKTVKNRLHLDLRPDDQEAEVRRLTALGAHRVDIGQGDSSWVVMADPEGNELCVLQPLSETTRAQWQTQYDAYRPV
jgi:predicted enzyme related to lactoylglutathione lyase